MLPIKTLIELTDRQVVISSNHYRVGSMNTTQESSGTRYNAVVYGGKKPANLMLRLTENTPEGKAYCACSCEYFAMHLETVLVLHGSTAPARAQGIAPKVRNPKMRPGLCPHLYKVSVELLASWHKKDKKNKSKVKSALESDESEPAETDDVEHTENAGVKEDNRSF